MTVTELPRKRRAKKSPVFINVVCHRCGAAGVRDSRDCNRCGGPGFTRGPEHHGVALNRLSPSERNLHDARLRNPERALAPLDGAA